MPVEICWEIFAAPSFDGGRSVQVSAYFGGLNWYPPPPPHLRIASEHAGGSDVCCASGEFDICFQWLTGKILTTQHLAWQAEVDATASAVAIFCFFRVGAQGQTSQGGCGFPRSANRGKHRDD